MFCFHTECTVFWTNPDSPRSPRRRAPRSLCRPARRFPRSSAGRSPGRNARLRLGSCVNRSDSHFFALPASAPPELPQVPHENCWDEPREHCEYLPQLVAKKHCQDEVGGCLFVCLCSFVCLCLFVSLFVCLCLFILCLTVAFPGRWCLGQSERVPETLRLAGVQVLWL